MRSAGTYCFWVVGGLLACVGAGGAASDADQAPIVNLWPDGKVPGAKGSEPKDVPSVQIYLPPKEKATGSAVVVCPGGGYGHLALGHEGLDIANWLNERGIAAFVLRYRLGPRYNHPWPLTDVKRALRFVRANASQYGVDPNRIGVWGFSAGGHLASTASTHFDAGDAASTDPIDRASSRPDFSILVYPVISMTDRTHKGSKRNLLGPDPDPELAEKLSSEKQVTKETPPTFLVHGNNDKGVVPEQSILYYLALRRAGVPAELHIYEDGKHGFGLAQKDPVLGTWPDRLNDWMGRHGLLEQN
ncbi:alpha/beta hydrolase [Planctomycetes bacterium Pan216]